MTVATHITSEVAQTHAKNWVEAKEDEKAAEKVLEAAKNRRKAAASALVVLGVEAGDTITVDGNRRWKFARHSRENLPYKAAFDAVRPMLTVAQEDVVQAQLDSGRTVTFVTALKPVK